MTLEELKIEVKKHGYRLTKDYKYPKLMPCVCGNKSTIRGWDIEKKIRYHKCRKCGLRVDGAKTQYETDAKWNEYISKEKNK